MTFVMTPEMCCIPNHEVEGCQSMSVYISGLFVLLTANSVLSSVVHGSLASVSFGPCCNADSQAVLQRKQLIQNLHLNQGAQGQPITGEALS